MSLATLRAAIRRVVKDDNYSVLQLTVACTSDDVTSALLEVTAGHLIITRYPAQSDPPDVTKAQDVNLDLTDPLYNTIGKLQNYLETLEGYSAQGKPGMQESFSSIGIEPCGPMECLTTGYDLKTKIFSDDDLDEFIERVIKRHNPSLTSATLPQGEDPMVLLLVQAELYRATANDAVRRKGMDVSVDQCLKIADAYEALYEADVKRLNRVISPPRETSEAIGVGDVMVGDLTRSSLRTGAAYPVSTPLGQDCPIEFRPASEQIVEDTVVELHFSRKRNSSFWTLEIWRDTRPGVKRTGNQTTQPTTSIMVGSDRNSKNDFFRDTLCEPETTYYYKVYIKDTTGEVMGTEELTVTTLALKVSFGDPAISPEIGDAGTVIAIALSAYDPQTTVVRFGGKILTGTWADPTFTSAVPEFVQLGLKDLVVTDHGLDDILQNAFTVT